MRWVDQVHAAIIALGKAKPHLSSVTRARVERRNRAMMANEMPAAMLQGPAGWHRVTAQYRADLVAMLAPVDRLPGDAPYYVGQALGALDVVLGARAPGKRKELEVKLLEVRDVDDG